MYNNDTVYGNSAVVYRLKKYYGVHFLHLFRPWDFSFTAKVYTNEMPCVLTSHKTVVNNDHGLHTLKFSGGSIQIASDSAADNYRTGTGAGRVIIEGVDVNYKPTRAEIPLKGLTSFTTFQRYRAINSVEVVNTAIAKDGIDSIGYPLNVGTIDVGVGVNSSGSLETLLATIEPGAGKANIGYYTLHSEESVYIKCIKINATNNASGIINMWMTDVNRTSNQGTKAQEYPRKRFTSVFSSNYNKIEFEEPITINAGTIYFSVDEISNYSILSLQIEGFKSDGHVAYESAGAPTASYYVPTTRNSDGTAERKRTPKQIREAVTKRALTRDTFYTEKSLARNNKRK